MAMRVKTACWKILKNPPAVVTRCVEKLFSSDQTQITPNAADKSTEYPRQIFSGIQPTGIPHIGNYLGAIKSWVELHNKQPGVLFSIVDLHSITLPQDPHELRQNTLDMVACLLACGLDPDRCILFQQSAVSQHTELSWILGCLCTLPRLQRLPQWKEKSEKYKEVGVGLLTYPILQSADILLYKATDVPVGEDQTTHIELARHLAKLFNNKYGEFFPQPCMLSGPAPRIRNLRNPSVKMSKSDLDSKSQINLNDSPDDIRIKVKKAVTDFTGAVTYDPTSRPGVSNLVEIHGAMCDLSPEEICEQCLHLDTAGYKLFLGDILVEKLLPIRTEIERLQANKDFLLQVLEKGRNKAHELAENNMCEVKRLVGFR